MKNFVMENNKIIGWTGIICLKSQGKAREFHEKLSNKGST